jgi:hypothetical protein
MTMHRIATLLFTGAAMLLADAAAAQMEPPTITCAQARRQVQARGAAVVHSSRHIYDRYVVDQRFCAHGETTRAAFIPTRDDPACFVGFRCVVPDGFPFRD